MRVGAVPLLACDSCMWPSSCVNDGHDGCRRSGGGDTAQFNMIDPDSTVDIFACARSAASNASVGGGGDDNLRRCAICIVLL
ncbi:unnamed protein product [Sphagnum balticum]